MKIPKVLKIVPFLLLGALIGYFLGRLLPKPSGPRSPLSPLLLPVLLLAPLLAIAWHEFGHVLGGWLGGFRLLLFTAGPLKLQREGERLRLGWNRNLSLWGGIAASLPTSELPAAELRRKMLVSVAAGPLASLAGGLLLFPGFLLSSYPSIRWPLLVFGASSLFIGLATLFPFSNGGFVNDGQRILQLLRRDPAGDRWVAGAQLSTWSLHARPREWPSALVETYTQDAPAAFDGILARWMRHSWHLDRGEVAEAGRWLEDALALHDQLPAAAQSLLHASAADYHARHRQDPLRAREHWNRVKPTAFAPAHALAVTEAAVLAAEGQSAPALAASKRALSGLASVSGTMRDYVREQIEATERLCS